ncbi:hypothetical protein D915_000593 [Fasciola hepatica]|uniref:Integrase catalytic domain-containing protein n=1 Tax=Fasciola hepatica TaxID=6192 RepID=A0A2H1CVI1_FASHE|nr:hypothetical protein D915_000593 [Fasciola hepatica]
MRINRFRPSVFNPYANDAVDKFHHQLKEAFRAHGDATNWDELLSVVLLGIRTDLRADIRQTTAVILYGRNLRHPDEFLELDSSFSINDELDWVECFKLYLLDTFMDKVC